MTERILVVDDYEPWRRQLCSVLRKSRRWKVVGEAPDGLEAIQQAEALRPDLILLDIELPTLSGIEAARRILARDPSSRILFVSAHRSLDIVEAAMRTGARGYIAKSDAECELLPAMETIVKGQRFVGAMLTGRTFDSGQDDGPARHEVGFYSEDAFLLDDYARFAKAALDAGKAFILWPARHAGPSFGNDCRRSAWTSTSPSRNGDIFRWISPMCSRRSWSMVGPTKHGSGKPGLLSSSKPRERHGASIPSWPHVGMVQRAC